MATNPSNLEWNHSKDIIFTSESLEEFIKLIKMHNTKHIHVYSINGNGDYTLSSYTKAPKIAVGNSTVANTAEFDPAEINALPNKGYNNYIAIVKDNIPWQSGATNNITSGRHTFLRVGNEVKIETGDSNGQVKFTLNGTATNIYVKGFNSNGYTGPFKPAGQSVNNFLHGDGTWSNTLPAGLNISGGDLNLYTSSSDSPDIVWWYANKGKEQARIWMGSGTDGSNTFTPLYRCYNSSGIQLYSGNLVLGNGTGASGTWGINITGNANTASKWATARTISLAGAVTGSANIDGSNNVTINTSVNHSHDDRYVELIGDTMSGGLYLPTLWANQGGGEHQVGVSYNGGNLYLWGNPSSGTAGLYDSLYGAIISRDTYTNGYTIRGQQVYGAVFNDYAEYRSTIKLESGRVVYDNDDGTLSCSNKRLIPGAQVISDTFGFSIGETETAKTPLAIAGRVLVYTYQPRENYHAGMAVCSAPNGTIDIMTREEIRDYPDCIIGIVSEIPQYETWGTNNIKVDNRIWIKVK